MNYSPIIVGTMRWGVWGAHFSKKQVQQMISTCLEHRLTTFDHADIYGDYSTEKLFGNAFSEMKIDRQHIQLISKCGIEMPCDSRNYRLKSYNCSKDHILKSVDKSLQNLGVDYLDLLLLHRPSPLMNPHEIAAAFGILRSSGKVLNFGVSNFSVSQFDLLNDLFPLNTNQIEVSINHTAAFRDGTLDQMMRHNLSPMAYSVMGNYFSESTAQNDRIRQVLINLCSKYEAEENQLLLSFLRKHPAGILPVVGTSKPQTILKFKESLKIELDREDWFMLLEAAEGKEVP